MGSSASGVRSMGCLTWQCQGTPIGEEKISEYSYDLIYLLLLCGEIGHKDLGCGCDLSLVLRANHEEDKLPHLRDDLPALLIRDQGNITRWD